MSPVTKIFVVLLVVASLLLSAATVTFVNSVEASKSKSDALTAKLEAEKAKATESAAMFEAQLAAATSDVGKLTTALATEREKLRSGKAAVDASNASLAQARQDLIMAKAEASRATAAVEALSASSGEKDKVIAQLRSEYDRSVAQVGDLNRALTETTNSLTVTEQQRRLLAEQIAELKVASDKFRAALMDRGVDPDRVNSGVAAGAPAIKGVVRDTVNIGGVDYATISVGADDAVKKGMQFNILDGSSGKFLGKLVVVEVQSNEAIGSITATDASAVRAGAEVRTQL